MDFKFKGIGWVGGIYQKFETLCHEVDNIVNQDTVNYVENQAQSVGKRMKRFYSDVTHDILPPLKHESQEVALRRSATIDTYVKSKAAIQEDHIDTVCKLSHVEPVAADPIEKKLDHASNELCLSVQFSIPTSVDALYGAESDIISRQVSDVMKTTSSDVSIEENAIREKPSGSDVLELISPSEEESFGDSLANKFIDCNDKISSGVVGEVSLTMSVNDMEFQTPKKEGTVNDNIAVDVVKKQLDCAFGELCLVDQPGNPNSVDSLVGKQYVTSEQVADFLNDTKPEVNLEENATIKKPSASEVSELISPVEKESCGASLLSEFIGCNDKGLYFKAEVSPATSVRDVRKPSASDVSEFISPGEEESVGASLVNEFVNCNDKTPSVVHTDVSFATLVQGDQNARKVKNDFAGNSECVSDASGGITSSKMTSSVICCEEDMAEVGVDSSCGSVFKEFYLPENSPENSPAKAFIYHDPVDVAELVSQNVHSSSMLTALLSNEKELTGPVSISSSNDLSMESLENDASRTVNSPKSLTGISGNKNVYFGGESAQLQALSSSDIGPIDDSTDDISISSMETIELYDEVKLEDSCVIVDSTALYAVSRIMKKHRSYKKRIQDALTSKKRLVKEYEQLAIWFGDADMGSIHDHLRTLRPSSSSTTSECKNTQTELVCDSEWELL